MEEIKTIGFEEQFKTKYKLNSNPDDDRYIYLVPQDMSFPKRFREASENIKKRLSKIPQESPKTADEINAAIDAVYELDQFIKGQIDYIFGYEVSVVVFGDISCITVDNNTGEYLFEEFLNCMLPIIESECGISAKKIDSRVKKYTSKKGAHPANKR